MSFWSGLGKAASKVDWGAVAGTAAQVGGAVYLADQQNEQSQQATDALINASDRNAEVNREIYYDTVARARPDVVAGHDAKRLRMASYGMDTTDYDNAFAAVPEVGSVGGGLAAPTASDNGLVVNPDTIPTSPEGTPNFYGGKSLVEQITGHNPSIYSAVQNGQWKDKEWWLKGGFDIPTNLWDTLGDKIGLPTPKDVFSDGADRARWDYANKNVNALNPDFDYAEYAQRYNITNDTLKDNKYYGGMIKGFDLDGDGSLSDAEAGAWHWSSYGEDEGRTMNSLIPTVEESTTSEAASQTIPQNALMSDHSVYGAGASNTALPYNSGKTTPPWATEGEYQSPVQNEAPKESTEQPIQNTTPDWENAFKNSGDYKYGVMGFDLASTNQLARDSAKGTSISGAHNLDVAKLNSMFAGNAYNNWDRRLAGVSGEGDVGTQTINNAASNYGLNVSNANYTSGNALANFYGNKQDTTLAGINAGIAAAGENGWL